jgi:hypothetical protein
MRVSIAPSVPSKLETPHHSAKQARVPTELRRKPPYLWIQNNVHRFRQGLPVAVRLASHEVFYVSEVLSVEPVDITLGRRCPVCIDGKDAQRVLPYRSFQV